MKGGDAASPVWGGPARASRQAAQGGAPTHSGAVPAEDAKPESNHEAPSDKLQWRNLPQNNWPVILVSVKIMKGKEKTEGLFQMKETKEIRPLTARSISGRLLGLILKDVIVGTIDNIGVASEDRVTNVSMSAF